MSQRPSTSCSCEPPAPDPGLVRAAREHLTSRYARGVDTVLWEANRRPLSDHDAIKAVITSAGRECPGAPSDGPRGDARTRGSAGGPADGAAGPPDGTDLAAALLLVHALRLDADRLECDLLSTARGSGMTWESIAALLELPTAGHAERRYERLLARRELPVAEVPAPRGGGHPAARPPGEPVGTAADHRADAAHRTRERDEPAAPEA